MLAAPISAAVASLSALRPRTQLSRAAAAWTCPDTPGAISRLTAAHGRLRHCCCAPPLRANSWLAMLPGDNLTTNLLAMPTLLCLQRHQVITSNGRERHMDAIMTVIITLKKLPPHMQLTLLIASTHPLSSPAVL